MKRDLLEFRTPQHPSLGTNNWGGASPLLARNVPKESLEQRYINLNTICTRDEIFPAADENFNYLFQIHESKHECNLNATQKRRGMLSKLMFLRKEKTVLGGKSKKKRWFPRLDPQNRWPQGWC
ncbi:hypothetical protein O6P43_006920 [Quillaja saponaria]|uniref:Uncharacterized protein n=1 Tax=Quillaja saponaria TaxID=32244 RepID=A0AAD7QAA2_QUISA|nr:hypothetical protein O6P43_006920 [Quillaja saponaria]